MRAGKLRHRVRFEKAGTGAEDGFGNAVAAWIERVTVFGDLRETTGAERIRLGRVEAAATATLRVRRSSGTDAILEADRVLDHLGRTWSISGKVDLEGRGRSWDFLLERGGAT